VSAVLTPSVKFYVPTGPSCEFGLHDLVRKKSAIRITESDRLYGGVTIKTARMAVVDSEPTAGTVTGWIVQNPDDSFWLDSLEHTQAKSESWMSDMERMMKLGFKVVQVQFNLDSTK